MQPPASAYRIGCFADSLPFGNEKLEKARGWGGDCRAGNGAAKLAYAEKFLAEHKIKLDVDTLKAMINAKIKKMEQGEVKEEEPIAPEVSD